MNSKNIITPISNNFKALPRQKYPPLYTINGSLYLSSRNSILKNKYKNLILIQSSKTNPYKLLNDNYIIVGYYSTLLYEAKYFLNKKC
mgnify:CR=1 FL=1